MDVPNELADVPPEEFIAARDALAKALRADGRSADADAVKQLRKPTVARWIADQVHRHDRDAVDALEVASRAMAQAQEAAITGGDRAALRDATTARRAAFDALGAAIDDRLARDGRPPHHREEVLKLVEERVTADIAGETFGLRDDLELPARTPRPKPVRDQVAERRAMQAKAAVEAAEARVERAREELAQAEAALEAARDRYAGGSP